MEASQTAAGQQSAFTYLRHGQTPFFRLPSASLDDGGDAAFGEAEAVLLGVPWDGGTPVQAGARIAAAEAVPFVVGGDHSVALPALRAVAKRHGPLAVVHVDAHLDTSDGELWGDAFHHGTPLRHALQEGLVARGQLFQIGIRASAADAAEAEYPVQFGARAVSIDALAARGAATVACEVRRAVGDRPVYLTFDVDAVDPAFAPGTGSPVPGGMSAREALALIRALAGVRLVGMDVVEVCPPLDHAEITSHLAAHVLFEGLAIAALGRRPRVT